MVETHHYSVQRHKSNKCPRLLYHSHKLVAGFVSLKSHEFVHLKVTKYHSHKLGAEFVYLKSHEFVF
jgi:hypothetical protein